MENPKKYSNDQKPSFVQEPETIFETKQKIIQQKNTSEQEIIQQKNTSEQEILLQKLLALGLKQSEMGLGITNEEMKRITKLKFPFLR